MSSPCTGPPTAGIPSSHARHLPAPSVRRGGLGDKVPVPVSCDKDDDLTVATIPIGSPLAMTAKVEPGTVKADATDATVLVTTSSPVTATGDIRLLTEGDKTVGTARLNKTGNVRVKLDPYFTTGRRTLRIASYGDAEHAAREVITKFSVVP